jgi:hypothetical protein
MVKFRRFSSELSMDERVHEIRTPQIVDRVAQGAIWICGISDPNRRAPYTVCVVIYIMPLK